MGVHIQICKKHYLSCNLQANIPRDLNPFVTNEIFNERNLLTNEIFRTHLKNVFTERTILLTKFLKEKNDSFYKTKHFSEGTI